MTQTRRVGEISVSVPGLGCNNFGARLDDAGARAVVDAAWELGVTHFDTAESYSNGASEEILGRALGKRRDRAVIATKFGREPIDTSEKSLLDCIEARLDASLRRLNRSYIDIYYLHRFRPEHELAELLIALDQLVAKGKIREIGCSNFSVGQLREASAVAVAKDLRGFACIQNEYSLLQRSPETEMLDACRELETAFVAYFPLASGLLTGKYRRHEPPPPSSRLVAWADHGGRLLREERLVLVESLEQLAASHGRTLIEFALSYVAAAPSVASVLTGAMSAEQVRSNTAAIAAWPLTPSERVNLADVIRQCELESVGAAESSASEPPAKSEQV